MKHIYIVPFLFLALNVNFTAQAANNEKAYSSYGKWQKKIVEKRIEKTQSPTLRNIGAIASGIGNVVGGVASFCSHHPFIIGGLVLGSGLMWWRYKNSARSKINQVLELLCMNKKTFWKKIEDMAANNRMVDVVVENLKNKQDLFAYGNDKLNNFLSKAFDKKTITGSLEQQIADLKNLQSLCHKRKEKADNALEIIGSLNQNDYQDGNVKQFIWRTHTYNFIFEMGHNAIVACQYGIDFIKFTENFMKNKQISCAIKVLKKLSKKDGLVSQYATKLTNLNQQYQNYSVKVNNQLVQQIARQNNLTAQQATTNKTQGKANKRNAKAHVSNSVAAVNSAQVTQQTLALKQQQKQIWLDRAWLAAKVAGVIVLGAAVYFGVETARVE